MSTVKPPENPEDDPKVKAVFDEIRKTRNTDLINNIWRFLAFDPDLLEATWREVKSVMASPSYLDAKTKEMIYMAVSITNSCSYCAHSHTASAKAKGMTNEEHAEVLKIIALASKTNTLVTALQVPLDPVFDAEHKTVS